MHLREQIEKIFGDKAFSQTALQEGPESLRFELSEGGSTVEQLLVSLQKANNILNDIFTDDSLLVVCLRTRSETSLFSHRALMSELYTAGISITDAHCLWMELIPYEERHDKSIEECWFNLAFEVPVTMLPKLLWCTHASDFGSIRLRPPCTVYLFNMKDQVMALPFEDLSMDVIGADPALSTKLLSKFDQYLPGKVNKANPLAFDLDSLDKF